MKIKRFLSDSEILKWNDRLANTSYMVSPAYSRIAQYPSILVKQRPFDYNNRFNRMDFESIKNPIDFIFSFSVSKNRVDNFFQIFDKWFSEKIENSTMYHNTDLSGNIHDEIVEIKISDSIIKSKDQIDHRIRGKEYTKFTYTFEGNLSSIMAYVMFLEDSIEIFSNIWGYTEDGEECQLTKFKIGDVVIKNGDQTDNYLILDFYPTKSHNSKIHIDYEIAKMYEIANIIKYDASEIVVEDHIMISRDNRIDDILN